MEGAAQCVLHGLSARLPFTHLFDLEQDINVTMPQFPTYKIGLNIITYLLGLLGKLT